MSETSEFIQQPKWEFITEKVCGIPTEVTKVAGQTLRVVPVEHRNGFEPHSGLYQELVPQARVIIPEYFPPEMISSPFLRRLLPLLPSHVSTNLKDINGYFGPIAHLAGKHGKDMTVMDPAFDERFAVVRFTPVAITAAGGALVTLGSQIEHNNPAAGKTIRRIGGVLGAAGALSFGARWAEASFNIVHPVSVPSEATMRHIVVAQGLNQHMQNIGEEREGETMLIYPPAHWKSIKRLLQNQELRMSRFRTLRVMLDKVGLGDLASERNYVFQDDAWQKVSSSPIS